MVEFIGLIKVNVVRGTNLAIRDMVTSDPYVILSLGNQVILFSSNTLIFSYSLGKICYFVVEATLMSKFVAVSKDTGYKE